MNEQNEIRGDEREDVRAELERIEGYEEGPQPQTPTDEDMDAHYKHWADGQARMGIDDPEPMMGSRYSVKPLSDDGDALASARHGYGRRLRLLRGRFFPRW